MIHLFGKHFDSMANRVRFLLFILVVFGVIGCSKDEDVSSNPKFGNFSAVKGPWKTKVELYLLRPQQSYEPLLLITDAQYANFNGSGLGTIPIGTEICITKLIRSESINVTLYKAVGILTTGPYSNRDIHLDRRIFVNNALISQSSGPFPLGERGWGVDPEKLERIDDEVKGKQR